MAMSETAGKIIEKLWNGEEVSEEEIRKTPLSETDLIEILSSMGEELERNPVPGAKSVYLANGWFTPSQVSLLFKQYRALLLNETIGHIHVPLLHQYQGAPYIADEGTDMGYEWATMTYKADVLAIHNSDLVVAAFPAGDEDNGTAVETGIAIGSHTPVVTYYEGDIDKYPINLMIAFGADSYVRSEEELTTFDFLDIAPKKYEGKII